MKALIWGVFALLALCWTGIAAASVQITEWLLTLIASGQVVDATTAAGEWPEPAWLAAWFDPGWIKTLQGVWLGMVQWLTQVLPGAGGLMAWVTPLVWMVWALGLLCLLLPALGLHWVAGRLKTPSTLRNAPPPPR